MREAAFQQVKRAGGFYAAGAYTLRLPGKNDEGGVEMTGIQNIFTNRAFTLEELIQFMRQNWATEQYNDFIIDRPTPLSAVKGILLPATPRFWVCVFPHAAGGLFNKKDKVTLSTCENISGAFESLASSIPTHNILYGAWAIGKTMSKEKERKGPAEEALQKYAMYMRELLGNAGYLQ